jgi:hypothetical protein
MQGFREHVESEQEKLDRQKAYLSSELKSLLVAIYKLKLDVEPLTSRIQRLKNEQ